MSAPTEMWRGIDDHDRDDKKKNQEPPEKSPRPGSSIGSRLDWADAEKKRETAARDLETHFHLTGLTEEDLIPVFDRTDGPAITLNDVVDYLDCSPMVGKRLLDKLYEQGRVDRRRAGNTTIWWLKEDNLLNRLDPEVKEELKEYKRGRESLAETFERIRGSPPPDLLRSIVGDIEMDGERAKEKIREKRERGRETRKDLRERFE